MRTNHFSVDNFAQNSQAKTHSLRLLQVRHSSVVNLNSKNTNQILFAMGDQRHYKTNPKYVQREFYTPDPENQDRTGKRFPPRIFKIVEKRFF